MWSYSGDPSTSPKDEVRFLIGDTDQCDQILQDPEILFVLAKYNFAPMNAAIRLCETVISKYSRLCNEAVGQVRIDYKDVVANYKDTMNILRARLAMEDATPYCGGISVSDKMTNAMNPNRVRPDFTKHMMENYDLAPWTTQGNYWMWLNFQA